MKRLYSYMSLEISLKNKKIVKKLIAEGTIKYTISVYLNVFQTILYIIYEYIIHSIW